jgi:hypothetical protein
MPVLVLRYMFMNLVSVLVNFYVVCTIYLFVHVLLNSLYSLNSTSFKFAMRVGFLLCCLYSLDYLGSVETQHGNQRTGDLCSERM